MTSAGLPQGFGSDPSIGSGQVRGLPHLAYACVRKSMRTRDMG